MTTPIETLYSTNITDTDTLTYLKSSPVFAAYLEIKNVAEDGEEPNYVGANLGDFRDWLNRADITANGREFLGGLTVVGIKDAAIQDQILNTVLNMYVSYTDYNERVEIAATATATNRTEENGYGIPANVTTPTSVSSALAQQELLEIAKQLNDGVSFEGNEVHIVGAQLNNGKIEDIVLTYADLANGTEGLNLNHLTESQQTTLNQIQQLVSGFDVSAGTDINEIGNAMQTAQAAAKDRSIS